MWETLCCKKPEKKQACLQHEYEFQAKHVELPTEVESCHADERGRDGHHGDGALNVDTGYAAQH